MVAVVSQECDTGPKIKSRRRVLNTKSMDRATKLAVYTPQDRTMAFADVSDPWNDKSTCICDLLDGKLRPLFVRLDMMEAKLDNLGSNPTQGPLSSNTQHPSNNEEGSCSNVNANYIVEFASAETGTSTAPIVSAIPPSNGCRSDLVNPSCSCHTGRFFQF
ncbi:hypothetical protein NDU88_003962 [Pleurodeles waltl]|uniref:Uncharacterized protein n=1 Tax=Pleurodeles waltl TaxID=8319 RepID=A0AAV7SHJ4_PLEWA|nr:hypothetical protein NDU88_003962 [Pleurodeles waltl]